MINESTLTVQECIIFARTHVKLMPLAGVGGFSEEPALKWANKIKKRIINRKYNWDWNRKSHPMFLTQENIRDYPVFAEDLGWIERAHYTLQSDTSTVPYPYELEVVRNLRVRGDVGLPSKIALDRDENGLYVFRFASVPDSSILKVYVDYQRRPKKITALDKTFAPIPDDMEDIILQFFLAFAYKGVDKSSHIQELAEATILLNDYIGRENPEQQDEQFVPDSPLIWLP